MSSSFTVESGYGETQGRRDTMEDAHVVFDDILAVENIGITSVPGQRVSFYGVYDGHGGVDAAKLVQRDLHISIVSKPEFAAGDIEAALRAGFAETDLKIVTKSNEEGWMNGSTGVVGVLVDSKLYIANVGDSEACLVREVNNEVVAENLTTPHKASDPIEKKRVEELGGHVFFGRVFGALAVSRSFGDSKFKTPKTAQNFVSCEPAIRVVDIRPDHTFMILACDGLWDVMNHTQAAQFAKAQIAEGKSAKAVAHALVSEALRRKTEDNVTVVVVLFNRNGNDATAGSAEAKASEESEQGTQDASSESKSPEKDDSEIPSTPVITSPEARTEPESKPQEEEVSKD